MTTLTRLSLTALLALVLALPGVAGPTQKVSPTSTKVPPKAAAAPVSLGAGLLSSDLKRIAVGNQAGLLKIVSRDKGQVLFVKDTPGTDMRGVDGVQWAPLNDGHRRAIYEALTIRQAEVDSVGLALVSNYDLIPRREAIVLMGVLSSDPHMAPQTSLKIRRHLDGVLANEKDVGLRRQAVLALALMATTDETSVRAVIAFMTQSHNAWETFTTQQYFRYHKDEINRMAGAPELMKALSASGNPYASLVLEALVGSQAPYAAGSAPAGQQPSGKDSVLAPGSAR